MILVGAGQWSYQPDFARALELYRNILSEYRKGETLYYDDAVQQIGQITGPTVSVSTSSVFLPGSEVELHLAWRNVTRVELELYPIDLIRSPDLARFADRDSSEWLGAVDLNLLLPLHSWSIDTDDRGEHVPGQQSIRLPQRL